MTACASHGAKRGGGLNSGKQRATVTLLATQNDLALGQPTAMVRLTPASGGSTLTGLDATPFEDGDLFWIRDESATDTITLTNADSGSLAANRFLLPGAVSLVLQPKSNVMVEFDKTAGFVVSYPTISTFSGPVTFNGTMTTSNAQIGVGQETVTSGALSTQKKTLLSVTGTQAYTLADCTVIGQRKMIEVTTAASNPLGTVTLTTTFNSEPTTHVFTAVGQKLTLECLTGNAWHIVDKVRAGGETVVVGTTTLTGHDMMATINLSVTGTVTSTSASLQNPNCNINGERLWIDVTTAATSASGTFKIGTALSTVAAAITQAAGIGNSGTDKTFVLGLECDGTNWQVKFVGTNTGVTLS